MISLWLTAITVNQTERISWFRSAFMVIVNGTIWRPSFHARQLCSSIENELNSVTLWRLYLNLVYIIETISSESFLFATTIEETDRAWMLPLVSKKVLLWRNDIKYDVITGSSRKLMREDYSKRGSSFTLVLRFHWTIPLSNSTTRSCLVANLSSRFCLANWTSG